MLIWKHLTFYELNKYRILKNYKIWQKVTAEYNKAFCVYNNQYEDTIYKVSCMALFFSPVCKGIICSVINSKFVTYNWYWRKILSCLILLFLIWPNFFFFVLNAYCIWDIIDWFSVRNAHIPSSAQFDSCIKLYTFLELMNRGTLGGQKFGASLWIS